MRGADAMKKAPLSKKRWANNREQRFEGAKEHKKCSEERTKMSHIHINNNINKHASKYVWHLVKQEITETQMQNSVSK